jgi:hypothetical protein
MSSSAPKANAKAVAKSSPVRASAKGAPKVAPKTAPKKKTPKKASPKSQVSISDAESISSGISISRLIEKNRLMDEILEKQNMLSKVTPVVAADAPKPPPKGEDEDSLPYLVKTFLISKASNAITSKVKLCKILEMENKDFIPNEFEMSNMTLNTQTQKYEIKTNSDAMACLSGLLGILAAYNLTCLAPTLVARMLNKTAGFPPNEFREALLEFSCLKNLIRQALAKARWDPLPGEMNAAKAAEVEAEVKFDRYDLKNVPRAAQPGFKGKGKRPFGRAGPFTPQDKRPLSAKPTQPLKAIEG